MNLHQLGTEIDINIDTAKEVLIKEKALAPMAFVFNNKEINIAPLPFKNPKEQHELLDLLKHYVTAVNAEAVIILTESWYVQRRIHDDISHTIPSKEADRKECIFVFGECIDGYLGVMQLFHKENDKIIFDGEPMKMKERMPGGVTFGITKKKDPMYG